MKKKTRKLRGGSNIAYRLRTGKSLRKSGSNLPKQSKGKKSKVRRGSPLWVNSKDEFEFSFTIGGFEEIEDNTPYGKENKYQSISYVGSRMRKVLTTTVKVDEKINDILEELNRVSEMDKDGILWNKIKLFKKNIEVSHIIVNYPKYRYLGTTMGDTKIEGESAELKIKRL